ncbi:hypothetical protein [Streptomyces brasiliensis]|nr:hypothetical protein [Streptomyces brasiliensis]
MGEAECAVETARAADTAVEEVRFVLFDDRAYWSPPSAPCSTKG